MTAAPVALSTIVRGSSRGSCWARIGRCKRIAARVGQLESDQKVVDRAAEVDVGPAAGCDDLLERRRRGFIDQELAGIGPSFRNHGAGLAPDQLGATGSESAVTTQGELAGSAVKVAVAALHRLDRQPVADRPTTHAQRCAQRGQVVLKLDVQPEFPGVVPQRLARLVLEIARHNRFPFIRLEWRHARPSTGATAFDLAIVARRAAARKIGSKRARLNRSALDAPLDEPFPIAIELIRIQLASRGSSPRREGFVQAARARRPAGLRLGKSKEPPCRAVRSCRSGWCWSG